VVFFKGGRSSDCRSSDTDVDLPIVSADFSRILKVKQSLHRFKLACVEETKLLHRRKMVYLEATQSLHCFKMARVEATKSLHRFKTAYLEATKSLHCFKWLI
jgi:hypothetical protein